MVTLEHNITAKMMRKDLRTPAQTRQLSVELGAVVEADGSAQIAMGNTRIVASVMGPTQPRYSRHEVFDRATVDVEVEIPSNVGSNGMDMMQQKRKCEAYLRESLATCIDLKRFPRLLILFKVLVISNDGSMLSVALNACILSLLDAGLPMNSVPNAVTVCESSRDNTLLLDPSLEEESASVSSYTFTLKSGPVDVKSSADCELIVSECAGKIEMETLNKAINLAMQTSKELKITMRNLVEAKLSHSI